MDIVEKYGIGIEVFDRPFSDSNYAISIINRKGLPYLYDLDKVFWKPYWGISSIARKLGVSRQAVSPIFKKLYGVGSREVCREKKKIIFSEESCACQPDPFSKQAFYKDGDTLIHTGLLSEVATQKAAISMGLGFKTNKKATIDAMINGKLVEIKGTNSEFFPKAGCKTSYYKFPISRNQIGVADFFIFHAQKTDRFYIVPGVLVASSTFYIGTSGKTEKERWRERWDLLL